MKRKLLSVLLCLSMALTLLPVGAFAADFSDTHGHWAESSIQRWADYGIIGGYEDGTFGADKDLTRAEMCQIICNLLGLTPSATGEFTDVRAGDWYAGPVAACRKAGIISGYGDGRFGPNDKLTREQSMTILCNALGVKPAADTSSLNKFPDTQSVADWAKPYVAAMVDAGIVGGTDKGIEGSTDINRASVMAILDTSVGNYINKSGSYDLSDSPAGKITVVAAGNVTLTGETAGDVLVAEGSKDGGVTLDDAKVEGTVTVGGADASVKLEGKTEVSTVAVAPTAASAEVSVGKDAKADAVETEGANSKVAVEGTVGTLTVGEQASGAETTVAKGAEVTNLETKAADTTTTVAGKVENVTVAETAGNATVTAEKGAKIDNVTTNASNTKVEGDKGTITKVEAGANATGTQVDASGAKVENNSSDKVTNNKGETVADSGSTGTSNTTPNTPSGGGGGGGGSSSVSTEDVIAAPLYDHRQDADADKVAGKDYIEAGKLASGYSVTAVKDTAKSTDAKTYVNVTLTARNVMKHANSSNAEYYWVGIGVPASDADTFKAGWEESSSDSQDSKVEQGNKTYYTYYFNAASAGNHDNTGYVTVSTPAKAASGSTPAVAAHTTVYKITFNVTCRPEVENLKLHVVKNLGDVKALNLPESGFNALIKEGDRKKPDTFEAQDMPWLVVVYDRNVTGTYTFAFTRDGTALSQADTTSVSRDSMGAQKVQSWSMKPYDASDGKLWPVGSAPEDIYGTYGVTVTVDDHSATATTEYLDKNATYHTVTFKDLDSGKDLQTVKVKAGGTFTPDAAPDKTGYTFSKWLASDKTTEWTGENAKVTKDTTVYASYKANEYSVTYDANNGTGTAPTTSSKITYNESFFVAGNINSADGQPILTKSGYTFNGWNTKNDGSGTHFEAGKEVAKWTAVETAKNEAITLYAEWKLAKYTVKFMNDTTVVQSQELEYNTEITAPADLKDTADKVFVGWGEVKDGEVNQMYTTFGKADAPVKVPAKDVTYGAIWATWAKKDQLAEDATKVEGLKWEFADGVATYRGTIGKTLPSQLANTKLGANEKWAYLGLKIKQPTDAKHTHASVLGTMTVFGQSGVYADGSVAKYVGALGVDPSYQPGSSDADKVTIATIPKKGSTVIHVAGFGDEQGAKVWYAVKCVCGGIDGIEVGDTFKWDTTNNNWVTTKNAPAETTPDSTNPSGGGTDTNTP